MKENSAFGSRIEAKGFYSLIGVGNVCPFDAVSDFLRGLKGTTIDMFRHPDKLLAAQEKLVPFLTGGAIARSRMAGSSFCFVALHRGSDAFMSVKQFEKFYWPGLKNMLLALIDASIIPFVFWEGTMDSRLEYLRELPKGKVLGWFDRTDLFRAKELIGDTMCICGGMPISLLTSGTPEQIKNYAKRLIDVVGKGGGFIMGPITELDNTKPELVKVWVDFTREYGVYR
jgi:uroporphyrinogen-III decarboxylase